MAVKNPTNEEVYARLTELFAAHTWADERVLDVEWFFEGAFDDDDSSKPRSFTLRQDTRTLQLSDDEAHLVYVLLLQHRKGEARRCSEQFANYDLTKLEGGDDNESDR